MPLAVIKLADACIFLCSESLSERASECPYLASYSSCIGIDAMNELFPGALRSLCATEFNGKHLIFNTKRIQTRARGYDSSMKR